jgi:hypothetical protein
MAARILSFLTMACALLSGTGTVAAHHSFAMFDVANQVTLDGVVTAFEWTNPHAYIELDASSGEPPVKHWTIELGSPAS